jgi:ABC-2 type transport system ATP-binding protein
VILDEPANGLDPAGVVEIRELLRSMARERGITVFMSSHILAEVDRLATRIGVIHQGRLIAEMDAGELHERRPRRLVVDARDRAAARAALHAAAFVTREEEDGLLVLDDPRAVHAPEEIASLLVRAGVPPTRLAVEQEELEDYFFRLIGVTT